MRASTAYFAGAGTVVVALAIGLGGGLLMANIMNPHGLPDVGSLEQRQGSQQAQQSSQPSQANVGTNGSETPTPYLAGTQQAATTPIVVSPAPSSSPQPRGGANNASTRSVRPAAADSKVEKTEKTERTASSDATSKPAEPSTPAARDQGSSPENAYAKAQDADVKRSADEKRKADRAERRQQRAARRQQQREQEQRNVEAQAREDSEPQRNIIVRRDDSWRNDFQHDDSDRPTRMDFPRFNLFDQD